MRKTLFTLTMLAAPAALMAQQTPPSDTPPPAPETTVPAPDAQPTPEPAPADNATTNETDSAKHHDKKDKKDKPD